jgi:glycosyltransferase involved in cell wall biosynthesis
MNNISVAMATYNGAKYLEEQLFSVINQTFLPQEIIIVDDFSTDRTVEIIERIKEKYPFITLYKNEANLGPIKTFKEAVLKCNCNYIALCDQDDIWEENKLELCFKELVSVDINSKPSLVFSDLKMIDTEGNLIGKSFWNVQGYNPIRTKLQSLLIGNVVTGCTVMMNEKMKKEIAKMPNDIIMHDYWLALIAFSIGDFKVINETPIRYRVHENSVTLKSKITFIERVKLFLAVFFDKNNIYLSENIYQTECFFRVYESELTAEKTLLFNKFISLKKYNSLYRKFYVFNVKYLAS